MTKRGVRTMMLAGLGRMMAGTAMVVVVLAGVAQAAPAVSASFDIAAQPLGAALAAFGARTGISVSYPAHRSAPRAAQSLNPHSSPPGARGFVHPALSYALRRPKLFTKADRQISPIPRHSGQVAAAEGLEKLTVENWEPS